MAPGIILLVSEKNESDNNLAKLFEFMGVPYVLASSMEMLTHSLEQGIKCMAASSNTIRKYASAEDELHERLSSMLIYEAEGTPSPVNSGYVTFSSRRDICRELSGLSFKASNEFLPALKVNGPDMEELISIDKNPFFVLKRNKQCQVFVLPMEIGDIGKKLEGRRLVQDDSFIKIIPVVMFLRSALPECFGNYKNRYACLIIDDPLLRKTYGFIDYHKLIKLMDKYNFFTTIAVIPRNYNRTEKSIADLFRRRWDRFGICVHGCDHTGGEFGKEDREYLEKKISLSTARMIEHERLTGIPFDRVMVFPQGIFSMQAMEALSRCGYLAAVNSVAQPVGRADILDGSDYLRCNIMKYNFPLFLRNLPESIIEFAFDLFLGKPIFLVIHNEYLKGGCDQLIHCIGKINSLSENIRWKSVGHIVEKFVAQKAKNDSYIHNIDLRGLKVNGFNETMRILLRRFAFELRDNYLCRNDMLLKVTTRVKKLVFGKVPE